MQGISNHTYQDLIQDLSFIIRKTEDKCKFHVIRVGASTNRNMIGGGANEVQNFTASAYSVWSDRTFGPYVVTSQYCYLLSLRNFSLLFVDGVCIDCGADAGERVDAAVLSNDGPRI